MRWPPKQPGARLAAQELAERTTESLSGGVLNFPVKFFADANDVTGYHPTGVSVGSELVVESGVGYDERSGVFAGAQIDGLDWVLAPAGPDTNFELRISRLARYLDNSLVFTNPAIRIVLQVRFLQNLTNGEISLFGDGIGRYTTGRDKFWNLLLSCLQ